MAVPKESARKATKTKVVGSQELPVQQKLVAADEVSPRLQLAAMVATQLLASNKLLPNGVEAQSATVPDYDQAAFSAMRLISACESWLNRYESNQKSTAEHLHAATELTRKYPEGMPFKKAILQITGGRSEAEALPIYKRYLKECELPSFDAIGVMEVTDEMVTLKVVELRKRGFNHMQLHQAKREFSNWREHDLQVRRSAEQE